MICWYFHKHLYQKSKAVPSKESNWIYSIIRQESQHPFSSLISSFNGPKISWFIFLIYLLRTCSASLTHNLGIRRERPTVQGEQIYPHQKAKRQGQYWLVFILSCSMYASNLILYFGPSISFRRFGTVDEYWFETPLRKRLPVALSTPTLLMVWRDWYLAFGIEYYKCGNTEFNILVWLINIITY